MIDLQDLTMYALWPWLYWTLIGFSVVWFALVACFIWGSLCSSD